MQLSAHQIGNSELLAHWSLTMTDKCHVGDSSSAPERGLTPLSFDSIRNGLTVSDYSFLNTDKYSPAHPSMRLPEVSIEDSSEPKASTISGDQNRLNYCLTRELANPKLLPAFSSASLIACDPEFKILVTRASGEDQAQEDRAETARKLIEFTRKEERYRTLLEPYLEDLYEAAYRN